MYQPGEEGSTGISPLGRGPEDTKELEGYSTMEGCLVENGFNCLQGQ